MVTLEHNPANLRELRKRTGLTAKALANRIAEYLGETDGRDPMSVIMMERRGGTSTIEVRDALEHIFGEYGIIAAEVKEACRRK